MKKMTFIYREELPGTGYLSARLEQKVSWETAHLIKSRRGLGDIAELAEKVLRSDSSFDMAASRYGLFQELDARLFLIPDLGEER